MFGIALLDTSLAGRQASPTNPYFFLGLFLVGWLSSSLDLLVARRVLRATAALMTSRGVEASLGPAMASSIICCCSPRAVRSRKPGPSLSPSPISRGVGALPSAAERCHARETGLKARSSPSSALALSSGHPGCELLRGKVAQALGKFENRLLSWAFHWTRRD